jgi:hypothetical protein
MPAENKAKELYANAVEKARGLGLYNDCANRAMQGLKKYDPANFGEVPELTAPVAPMSDSPLPSGLLTEVDKATSEGTESAGILPSAAPAAGSNAAAPLSPTAGPRAEPSDQEPAE